MRKNYEKLREEIKEIENLFKKKMIEEGDLMNEDPDLIVLLARCHKLIKLSDEFTVACIDAMESQNKKLDEILAKVSKD